MREPLRVAIDRHCAAPFVCSALLGYFNDLILALGLRGSRKNQHSNNGGNEMNIQMDQTKFNQEQGVRATNLFSAIVLAAIDDAIIDNRKFGDGAERIARWARSRDGRNVLSCAGIDPSERAVQGMMRFVSKGLRTSVSLSREESKRQSTAA
jgi:hypothetical protein